MSEKVTFRELVESIADQTDNSRQFTHDFLKDFVAVIHSGLEDDETINIAGFGKFKLRPMDERKGYNPQTGENITIPAHNKVVFKPYKDLRELINAPYAHLEAELIDDETDNESSDTHQEESSSLTPPSSPVSQESKQEPPQEITRPDQEKAPWEQAINEKEDKLNPDDPSGFGDPSKQQTGSQPDEEKENTGDNDIVEYSPVVKTGGKKEEPVEAPAPGAVENTGEQEKTETDSPSDETGGFNAEELQHNTSSSPSSGKPVRGSKSNRNLRWMIAASVVLLLTAGAWYINVSTDGNLYSDLILESTQPADNTRQQAPVPDQQVFSPSVPGQRNNTSTNKKAATTGTSQPQPAQTLQTVAKGQTLWSLANQHFDDPYLWPWIYDENQSSIDNPDLILTGQKISLPSPEGSNGGLSTGDSLLVAMGYIETYRWYKNHGYEKAKYYLYAASTYKGNVFDHTDVNIDKADLAFANRVR